MQVILLISFPFSRLNICAENTFGMSEVLLVGGLLRGLSAINVFILNVSSSFNFLLQKARPL